MPMITPTGGWNSDAKAPIYESATLATRGAQYARLVREQPNFPWGKVLGLAAALSLLLGLIASANTTHSETPFLVQALVRAGGLFGLLAMAILIAYWYFLPTLKAVRNRKRLTAVIGVLNFFFGWTIVAWWLL